MDGYAAPQRGAHMSKASSAGTLTRILGFGFSVALAFGNTIGVGILRLPGEVVAALGDARMTLLAWILGGGYALLGAVSVAELAARWLYAISPCSYHSWAAITFCWASRA